MLHGKTALITGGNSGIGLATAKRLRGDGARVAITGTDSAKLEAARQEIGDETLAVCADVRSVADLKAMAQTVASDFGHLDILFANAGVAISANSLGGESLPVMLGVILGLTLGKPIGIFAACWLAVRAGVATLPQGATWYHLLGTGVLAGIGFTMSIFIASLAFNDVETLSSAKIAILIASALAGTVGIVLLSRAPAANAKRA